MSRNFVRDSGDPSVLDPIKAAQLMGRAATAEEAANAILGSFQTEPRSVSARPSLSMAASSRRDEPLGHS
jgi:hypothetical protein